MNNKGKYFVLQILFIVVACKSDKSQQISINSYFEDCNVVANLEVLEGDSVIICDYRKFKQKKNIPLEVLLQDFNIIKMESENDEGLIGNRQPGLIISEHYIAVFYGSYMPLKLYNKQGEFISNIGKIGQGTGEYNVIDNVFIDEKSDRIFVLPLNTKKLLVYDFDGNTYPSIPLIEEINIGNKILPDTKQQRLMVIQSPWAGGTHSVWIQDFQGNIIQGVKQSDYFKENSFFSESLTQFNTNNIEYFWLGYGNTNEYLYNYNLNENRLIPKFKMKNVNEDAIFIFELPHHYVIEIATPTTPDNDNYSTSKMIVDKLTLRGCFFDGYLTPEGILLDQYRLLTTSFGGYFGFIDFGSYIEEKIQRAYNTNTTSQNKRRLENIHQLIKNTFSDDDCSLLFYGKFK